MRLSDDDLRGIWQEGTAASRGDRDECLTGLELARLLSPDADAGERSRAATHMTACGPCAEEFRQLIPLMEWRRDLEPAFAPHDAARGGATAMRRWASWTSPGMAVAAGVAVMLLAVNGVVLFQLAGTRQENARLATQLDERGRAASAAERTNAELRDTLRGADSRDDELKAAQGQLAQLSVPRLDLPAVLVPRPQEQLRGAAEPAVITVSADALFVTLTLTFAPVAAGSMLEVEIRRPDAVRWVGSLATRPGADAVTLTLPGSYPAGQYSIRIVDQSHGRMPLGEYPVTVRHVRDRR